MSPTIGDTIVLLHMWIILKTKVSRWELERINYSVWGNRWKYKLSGKKDPRKRFRGVRLMLFGKRVKGEKQMVEEQPKRGLKKRERHLRRHF